MKTALLYLLFCAGGHFFTATDWHIYETKDISVEFPAKPEESVLQVPTEIGPMDMNMVAYQPTDEKDSNVLYAFASTVYPDSIINSDKKALLPEFFRKSINGAVDNVKGALLSQKEIVLGEYPGREATIDYGNGIAVIKMTVYLVKNNVYLLQTIAKTGNEGNLAAGRFHKSFRLKGK